MLDLSAHPHFKNNQHVVTEPYFRYYCGVPIRTENGINIGCLFVLDTELQPSMTPARLKVMGTCARNIMIHLQTVKDAHDKKRAMQMNMTMAEFINPRRSVLPERRSRSPYDKNEHERAPNTAPLENLSSGDAEDKVESLVDPAGHLDHELDPDSDDDKIARYTKQMQAEAAPLDQINTSQRMVTEADHQKAFDRAANLLRQSLELQIGGGVALLEATVSGQDTDDPPWQKNNATYSEEARSSMPFMKRSHSDESDTAIGHVTSKPQTRSNSSAQIKERVVLAAASLSHPENNTAAYGRADPMFKVNMTPTELRRLCKRYPKGKLFHLPDHLGDELPSVVLSSQIHYMIMLRRQFPHAKQIIFVPMFHANFNRWTACFAYTDSVYRVFSYGTDYLHTLAFCNAIRAEVVRMATTFADQQKGEFIGSVSHELRSPLHGILASIEFLQDTDCTAFQKSCIDSADACAQTLMDTGESHFLP